MEGFMEESLFLFGKACGLSMPGVLTATFFHIITLECDHDSMCR